MRWTNASLIYRRTKNTRAVQILLGHTKLESTESHMVSWTFPTDRFWPEAARCEILLLVNSDLRNCGRLGGIGGWWLRVQRSRGLA